MKYLILLTAIVFSSPAMAESAPQCSLESEGQTFCMSNRMCECKHMNGSLMKGTPEGYRWDCGITRPNCLDFNKTEETKAYDGPESVGLSNDKTDIHTNTNNDITSGNTSVRGGNVDSEINN